MEGGEALRGARLLYRAAECGRLPFIRLALAEGVDINTTEKARAEQAKKRSAGARTRVLRVRSARFPAHPPLFPPPRVMRRAAV